MISFEDFCWLYLPQPILEMANMRPNSTGLITTIHLMSKGGAKHGARVKVSNVPGTFHHKDNFTITNEPIPRVIGNCKLRKQHLDDIIDWVKLNSNHINDIWSNGDDMGPEEVANGFKKLI